MFKLVLRTHAFTKGIFFIKGNLNEKYLDYLKEIIFSYVFKNPKREIFIIIDTTGGNVQASLAFYDFIKGLENKTTAIVMGKCHSAGLVILASCQRRLSYKHSTFFFHQMTSSIGLDDVCDNNNKKISFGLQKHEKLSSLLRNLEQKEFGLSKEVLNDLAYNGKEYDKKLFADEVLELGVIHEIVERLPFKI
jgi:ATP-dependent Clp protease protease subunit